MMYQKIIVPIDHGNRNLKTEQHVFTSGILESDCKPVLGEFLQYNGRYYTLSEQRPRCWTTSSPPATSTPPRAP